MQNITFENNTAPYGNDYASYAVKIRLDSAVTDEIKLQNVGSGVVIDNSISLALVDYDNQTMVLENASQISIFAKNSSDVKALGTNTALLRQGVAVFDSIIFAASPGETGAEYYATSKAIDTDKISNAYGGPVSNNTISVDFRYCQPGEEITADNQCRK